MILNYTIRRTVILEAYGKVIAVLADADFQLTNSAAFKVKNDNEDRVLLEVKYADSNEFVSTYFMPGWNEDLVVAIKQNAAVSNLLYTE